MTEQIKERLAVDPESLYYSNLFNWVFALGRDSFEGEIFQYVGDKTELKDGEDTEERYKYTVKGVNINTVASDRRRDPAYDFSNIGYWEKAGILWQDIDKSIMIDRCTKVKRYRLHRFVEKTKGESNGKK